MMHSLFGHPPVHTDGHEPPGGFGVAGQSLLPPAAAVPPVPVAAPPLETLDEAPPELGPVASVELEAGAPPALDPVALDASSTPRPSKSFVHASVAHAAQSTTHLQADRSAGGNEPIPIEGQGSRAYTA